MTAFGKMASCFFRFTTFVSLAFLLSCEGSNLSSSNSIVSNSNSVISSNTVANSNANASSTSIQKSGVDTKAEPIPEGADNSIEAAKIKIAQHRDLAKQFVAKAKIELAGKPEIKTIEDSYRDLTASYNGWLTVVKIAIATNDKKFDKSKANQNAAKEANAKNEAFLKLVKSKTQPAPQQKVAILPLIGVIVKVGVEVWKAHKMLKMEQRQAVASYVEQALKWDSWDEIVVSSAASTAPASVNTNSTTK